MIEVSNAFKEAARAPVKVIRASIACENDTYTSSDVLVSLSKEDTGFYFSTTTKSLSIILNNQGAAIPATLAAVEKTDVSSGNRPYIG